jgi:hypothetical protein
MMYRWLASLSVVAVVASPCCAGEVDRFLPADTEIVVAVQVKQLLEAPVVKQHLLEPARQALKTIDEIESTLKDLGFDPFTDLDRVLVAGPGGAAGDKILVVAHGHFDLGKFKTKGEEAARAEPDILKILTIKVGNEDRTVYQVLLPPADSAFFVSLATKNTLLASYNKDYVLEALKNADPKSKAQLRNKVFQTAAEQVNPRQTVTLAATGSALTRFDLPENLRQAAGKLEALGGGLTVGDDIRLELVMQCGNEQQAREVARSINDSVTAGVILLGVLARKDDQMGALLEALKSVRATQKPRTATVTLKGEVSADLLGKFLKGL